MVAGAAGPGRLHLGRVVRAQLAYIAASAGLLWALHATVMPNYVWWIVPVMLTLICAGSTALSVGRLRRRRLAAGERVQVFVRAVDGDRPGRWRAGLLAPGDQGTGRPTFIPRPDAREHHPAPIPLQLTPAVLNRSRAPRWGEGLTTGLWSDLYRVETASGVVELAVPPSDLHHVLSVSSSPDQQCP